MRPKGEIIFLFLLFFAFCGGLYLSKEWSITAGLFPMMLLIGGIIFSGGLLTSKLFGAPEKKKPEKDEVKSKIEQFKESKERITGKNELIMVGWVLGYLAMILFFGFWIASALFPLLFLSVFGHENWKVVGIYSIGIWFAIYLTFGVALRTPLYPGMLGISL